MSRINTNIPALNAFHRLARNQDDLALRLHRLSTGLRINRGADDPAGLIASERLRSDIRGIRQAIDNSSRASNVITVAEGALNEASALLLDLQALVVATANEAGLNEEEVNANQLQVDSILASLNRIANTTTFAGRKLLDGSRSYLVSGVPPVALPTVELFAVQLPSSGSRTVTVKVTQSALTATVALVGTNTTGISTTSATVVEIKGKPGSQLLSFGAGTTLDTIRLAVNNATAITGVSAVVSTAGIAGVASALVLSSTAVGADAFVSVSPISGNLIESGNVNTTIRGVGREAAVLIDGQQTLVRGLHADVRTAGLDARFALTRGFAQTLSSASFTITGGGSIFQITPLVNPSGRIDLGINPISTTHLGTAATGWLYTLQSGGGNDLAGGNFSTAQAIVDEAVQQVAVARGRLGNMQRNQIDPNINSQKVALENVTASESLIRDADIAVEVSALTRAQILVQSTQNTLRVANSLPTSVLSLLSG